MYYNVIILVIIIFVSYYEDNYIYYLYSLFVHTNNEYK